VLDLAARTPQSKPRAAKRASPRPVVTRTCIALALRPCHLHVTEKRFCAADVFRFRLEPKIPAYAGGVVGVAFWDLFHGQTGVAPNAIELRPILGFACLSG